MRIKKYIARSMREALLQIKEELGEEAIILKTRKLPKKMFGIGGQEEIEVTAAVDEEVAKPLAAQTFQPLKVSSPGTYSRPRVSNVIDADSNNGLDVRPWTPPGLDALLKKNATASLTASASIASSRQMVAEDEPKEKKHILEIKENLKELKELLKTTIEKSNVADLAAPTLKTDTVGNGFSDGWAVLHKKLLDSEVKPQIAQSLLNSFNGYTDIFSDSQAEKKILLALGKVFPVAGPLKLKNGSPLIVAFVGPTGSGKTTTLAKLAAHCCLNKKKKVSIITADTYRIAAIEQIRMFADIVKVGLQVVFSPMEVPAALENCSGDDIVFIDTAGRSQRNSEHMEELKELIAALQPDETHLVVSATTKDSDLQDIIRRYHFAKINRLLFTKLDETTRLGNIFNIVSTSGVPVSYFTFGQSVPDDIELAQPGRFVQRLWEGKTL